MKNSWFIVQLDKNKTGFIHEGDAYTPVGYRVLFEKKNNFWRIVSFIAGD